LKKDSYQGIASAMPTKAKGQAASAAGASPTDPAAEAGFKPKSWSACLKACPDTNLLFGFRNNSSIAVDLPFLQV
jgi:hypothetical protein